MTSRIVESGAHDICWIRLAQHPNLSRMDGKLMVKEALDMQCLCYPLVKLEFIVRSQA
jgi:hypothetical protein